MQGALQREAALSVAGTADSKIGAIADSELGKFFGDVIGAQHSQKHERQADDYAFEFMQDNGYDAQACVTALEKLEAMSGGSGGGLAAWTATHPSPKARAKRMRKKLD
jgi:putative metalloprotease